MGLYKLYDADLSKKIVSYRRVKWFGLYVFFLLSLQSCDTGFILPLDNNKFSHDIPLSENRMVKVSSMYFGGWYYLLFNYNPNRSLDHNMYSSSYFGIVS